MHHRPLGCRQIDDPAAAQRAASGPTPAGCSFGGRDISHLPERELIEIRETIGFAFQFAALFDSLTICDNVALPLREHTKMPETKIRRRVEETLESVGSANVWTAIPAELSGGMVKRAGFARAVITNPQCVLYDEPTTGLDPIITHVLTDLIIRCCATAERNGRGRVARSGKHLSAWPITSRCCSKVRSSPMAPLTRSRRSPNPIVQQFLQGSEVGPIPI